MLRRRRVERLAVKLDETIRRPVEAAFEKRIETGRRRSTRRDTDLEVYRALLEGGVVAARRRHAFDDVLRCAQLAVDGFLLLGDRGEQLSQALLVPAAGLLPAG